MCTDSQAPYRCHVEWGRGRACAAAQHGDILVIVDTLSFSTSVDTVVDRGAFVYPCPEGEDPVPLAKRIGGVPSVSRTGVPKKGRYSLSARTYMDVEPEARIVLASLNGATCSLLARDGPFLFAAAPINARSVGTAVSRLLAGTDLVLTIVACGERWPAPLEDGVLRFAIEDYLGAGAVLRHIETEKSPDALVCEAAFEGMRDRLAETLLECQSGRGLRDIGFEEDVRHAARLNLYDVVPVLRGGRFEKFGM